MTLLGIVLCAISLILLVHSLARQSLIRALARELRSLRDREQELRIRFDDLNSKVNNTLVQISKQTGMFDKRVSNLEERLARGLPQEKTFELENDIDREMRERVARLEEIALNPSAPLAIEASPPESTTEGASVPKKVPVTNGPTITLSEVLKPWRDGLIKDLKVFSSVNSSNAKSLCDSMRKAFRDHHLDSLVDEDLVEQVTEALKTSSLKNGGNAIEQEVLANLLQATLRERMRPARGFDWKKDESDRRLRTMLLVGGIDSGKTTAAVGVAHVLKNHGARVILADCGVDTKDSDSLTSRFRDQELAIVAPIINAKPHHVAYKAIHRAQDEHCDVVILDTPAALSSRKKVSSDVTAIAAMIAREHPYPPHETVLVLNASDPKQAIEQGKRLLAEGAFSGLILTHLDKLPYAGAVLELVANLEIPLWYIGYGSSGRALSSFDAVEFSSQLFGVSQGEPVRPSAVDTTAPAAVTVQ